jgi:hypothetical protein
MTSNLTPPDFISQNTTYSQDESQRLLQHTKFAADSARYINTREIALYDLVELQTGQQWFNPANTLIKRYGFRKTFSISDAALTFAHGITGITLCTYIGGAFTDGTNFYPLPYVSTTLANQIQVVVSPTQVVITKGAGAPAITSGVLVLEYLRQ